MDRAELRSLLAQHRLAVISSLGSNGAPQSALVGIAIGPNHEIVFDTLKTSRKYANLSFQPRCSIVMGWSGEQTIQFEGNAELPVGPELERWREVYFAAWPEGRAHLSWPDIVHFVVRPVWIRYSDYDRVPAFIEEFEFGGCEG
ncbi:MAG TPA: pyridoxamine 5'-phosphate oxidase family protein [Acidisarcina sp.]